MIRYKYYYICKYINIIIFNFVFTKHVERSRGCCFRWVFFGLVYWERFHLFEGVCGDLKIFMIKYKYYIYKYINIIIFDFVFTLQHVEMPSLVYIGHFLIKSEKYHMNYLDVFIYKVFNLVLSIQYQQLFYTPVVTFETLMLF